MLICLITILIMAVIIYYLWEGKRSSFAFGNADLSYSNPSISQEGKYYDCIRNECGGETRDYICSRNCRIKSFRTHGQPMSVAERLCEGIQDEDDKYSCLTNALSNFKTSYRQYTP